MLLISGGKLWNQRVGLKVGLKRVKKQQNFAIMGAETIVKCMENRIMIGFDGYIHMLYVFVIYILR